MNTNNKKKNRVNVITLGCSKNLVDSEVLMKQLSSNQLTVDMDSNDTEAKTVIINTCGFIGDAKQESIDMILQFVKAKQAGDIEQLYVMGCLSERYKEELRKEIPEVDQYFGVDQLKDILATFNLDYRTELIGERETSTLKHFAYLKISEGCDRNCSYCAIPMIRGKHISRPMEELVDEAKNLVSKGVKELILIAQDLSYYGYDLYKAPKLAELLEKLSDLEGVEWVRLHYAYPAKFPKEVIQVMKERENVCNYLDIPIQHVSDKMLKIMRRGHGKQDTLDLVDFYRKEIPDMAIRTTLLVGHPGETEEDFEELKEFVKSSRFDRLGVFTYSHEEDTHSHKQYEDDIPEEIKQARADEIMEIQQLISNELNTQKIGKTYKVIIDSKEGDMYVGRTQFDSPEVDNEVLIDTDQELEIGNFYRVEVTSADDFDLYATII